LFSPWYTWKKSHLALSNNLQNTTQKTKDCATRTPCCYIDMVNPQVENWNHLSCRKVSLQNLSSLSISRCTLNAKVWSISRQSCIMWFFYMKEELWLIKSSPLIQLYKLHRKSMWKSMWPLTQDDMILYIFIYIIYPPFCQDNTWLITGFVTIVTRRVPLVEQELPNLPKHPNSPLEFNWDL
jgi:hypothetical protein